MISFLVKLERKCHILVNIKQRSKIQFLTINIFVFENECFKEKLP